MELTYADWSLDLSTVAVLAGITVLEGLRRVPPHALILRRIGTGPWRVARSGARPGLKLVSWAAPAVMHLVLESDDDPESWRPYGAKSLRTGSWLPALRVGGAAEWFVVVIGVPLATQHWGVRGLVLAVWAALMGALLIATLSGTILHRAGHDARRIQSVILQLLSPFSAPRAAEVSLEALLTHVWS